MLMVGWPTEWIAYFADSTWGEGSSIEFKSFPFYLNLIIGNGIP